MLSSSSLPSSDALSSLLRPPVIPFFASFFHALAQMHRDTSGFLIPQEQAGPCSFTENKKEWVPTADIPGMTLAERKLLEGENERLSKQHAPFDEALMTCPALGAVPRSVFCALAFLSQNKSEKTIRAYQKMLESEK